MQPSAAQSENGKKKCRIARLESLLNRKLRPQKHGRPRKQQNNPVCGVVEKASTIALSTRG